MKIKNLLAPIIIITAAFFPAYAHADDITVSDPWVQAMPPSQQITAAYMTISNNSFKDIILTSASSDIAGVTEIHKMSDMNGMVHMGQMSQLRIPALTKLVLQPGGVHFMLINLKRPVKQGDIVTITLHFEDGRVIVVNAQVKTA